MIELKIKSTDFDTIVKMEYIEFPLLGYKNIKGNQYPSNIYKIIPKIQLKELKPLLDDKFNKLLDNECKLGFKVQSDEITITYYIALTNGLSVDHDNELVRIKLKDIKNIDKKQYNKIKNNDIYLDKKLKIDSRHLNVDLDKLIKINDEKKVVLRNNSSVLDYVNKGKIIVKSKVSGHYYHYRIASYKILNNEKVICVELKESNRLIKEDYIHYKKLISNNENTIYKSKHIGQSVLVVRNSELRNTIKLKIKKEDKLNALNSAIEKGLIKFIFNKSGMVCRIMNITIQDFMDYIKYEFRFYDNNLSQKQTIEEYLKVNKAKKMFYYYDLNTNNTVEYYKIPIKLENSKPKELKKNGEKKEQSIKNKIDIVSELQVVDSSNNHVTRMHDIIDKTFYIRIKESKYGSSSILMEYNGHYCTRCKKYFDFKQSFIGQLKKEDISINRVETKLTDENNNKININNLRFELYNDESILHKFGYKVGTSGVSKGKRHKIIDKVIQNNILTLSEIKDILNRNISRFDGVKRYKKSVDNWREDLEYINKKYY